MAKILKLTQIGEDSLTCIVFVKKITRITMDKDYCTVIWFSKTYFIKVAESITDILKLIERK